MFQCIVCKIGKNNISNIFVPRFYFEKNLIKYNKYNGIIPMKNCVVTTHPKLFTQRKSQLAKKAIMG
jgi:hypothetical protein